MKKQLFSVLLFSTLLYSCKEQVPAGLVLSTLASSDTTYVTAQVETAQDKKVVIEEFTGASCSNCAPGSAQLKAFADQNPGRIITTAIHYGFLSEPPAGAIYDFRNADAGALISSFNEGEPGKPSATFDRVPVLINGVSTYFIVRGNTGSDWIAALPALLSKTTPVNIHLSSSYDAATNKVNVQTKIHFTAAVNEKLALTLYVLESGKKDKQEDNTQGEIPDYKFDHVLQKLITPVAGVPILDSLPLKVAGRVLEKSISFEPNITGVNGWNLDSCVIVGIVHKTGSSKAILHAEEVHLK